MTVKGNVQTNLDTFIHTGNRFIHEIYCDGYS